MQRVKYAIDCQYFRNPRSAHLFETSRPNLNPVQQRVVTDLTTQGIAFAASSELGISSHLWTRLASLVDGLAQSEAAREAAGRFAGVTDLSALPYDAYIVKLHPEGPSLRLDDPLLQVGLAPAMLDVIDSYLGLWAKLVYTDGWHTIVIDLGKRFGSQRWHRDPEDRRMVKVYLYFATVGEGSGAMEYLLGSQHGGPYQDLWAWQPWAAAHPSISRRRGDRPHCFISPPGDVLRHAWHYCLLRHSRPPPGGHRDDRSTDPRHLDFRETRIDRSDGAPALHLHRRRDRCARAGGRLRPGLMGVVPRRGGRACAGTAGRSSGERTSRRRVSTQAAGAAARESR